jgi:hypothetical protein
LKSRQLPLPKAAGETEKKQTFASDLATLDASPGNCPTLRGGRRADMGQRRTSLVNFDQYLESPTLSIVMRSPFKGE